MSPKTVLIVSFLLACAANAVAQQQTTILRPKQIGDVLKLSESATKSLLFRAYQTLREKLKDFV